MNIPNHDAVATMPSPVGRVAIYARENKVVFISMGAKGARERGKSPVLTKAVRQLGDYFSGRRKELEFEIEVTGTDFQLAVWDQISQLGFGETATYADIASAIGNPNAVRAVGGAVGANPVPLVIGCHRVLGANGRITGYSGGDGIPTKEWLLRHEHIEYKD
jgi:methylated-DNA-[protein]-cysteine S-methyltransferase